MAERHYQITVEVRAQDNIDGGTLSCLLGMVSASLEDGDVPVVRLAIEEVAGG